MSMAPEDKKSTDTSELISETANKVVPSVMQSLLGPSADLLGCKFRAGLESLMDKSKDERREENLEIHINRIRKTKEESEHLDDSIEQLDIFDDWADHVQNVDHDDKEVSAVWESALNLALRREPEASLMLRMIKQLEPVDIRILLNIDRWSMIKHRFLSKININHSHWVNKLDKKHFRTIIEHGLIKTKKQRLIFTAFLAFCFSY